MLCSTIESKLEDNNTILSDIANEKISYEDVIHNPYSITTIKTLLRKVVINKGVVPIICGSSLKNKGVNIVLDSIVDYLPSPDDIQIHKHITDSTGNIMLGKDDEPLSALVFKCMNDKYVGSMTATRIYSGSIHTGDVLYNPSNKKHERIARIIRMHSDKRKDIDQASAGDIVGLIGLKKTVTGHTLCSEGNPIVLEKIQFAEPVVSSSIKVNNKDEYEKLTVALRKLTFEDPSFSFRIDRETKETLISGMGSLHLEIMVSRMEEEFGIKAILGIPQVCYRETITQATQQPVEGKYIKQSGGRGQYGHVVIHMEPSSERLEFVDQITGGAISDSYKISIKKALDDIIETGIIANYPIFGVKITLINGSEHEVDSSDIAFKIATEIAFKEAFSKCKPILLEPIAKVVIVTPEINLGDVSSNISAKRGIIENIRDKGASKILTALIPLFNIYN